MSLHGPDADARRRALELYLQARHEILAAADRELLDLALADGAVRREAEELDRTLARVAAVSVDPRPEHRRTLAERLAALVEDDVVDAADRPAGLRVAVHRIAEFVWGPLSRRFAVGRSLALACGILAGVALFQLSSPTDARRGSDAEAATAELVRTLDSRPR